MKKFTLLLALLLAVSLLAGCAGTPVIYYTDCTCPVAEAAAEAQPPAAPAEEAPEAETPAVEAPAVAAPAVAEVPEGGLLTGLHIATSVGKSASASAEAAGAADYDVTMVAVLVDGDGIIQDCKIDGIAAKIGFDATGAINVPAELQTKNELGKNYGMGAISTVGEWDAQAAALAAFAVGKTVEQLRSGAVSESGYAPEGTDLASSATIYLGGYVSAIEQAVAKAQYLGAMEGDVLKMATNISAESSTAAAEEQAGNAQLDVDVTALTMNGDVISSCVIDSTQAKVAFDANGAVDADAVKSPVPTKTELGDAYHMVLYGQAKAEWYQQAASFAAYVTGKTVDEVSGIAIDENTKPTDADLTASVTIAIGGFQGLIAKAAK